MTNRKNLADEYGRSNLLTLSVAAIAICGLIAGAAVLAPAGAASHVSTTAAYTDSTRDFPDQFVNQSEQITLMMYYLDD